MINYHAATQASIVCSQLVENGLWRATNSVTTHIVWGDTKENALDAVYKILEDKKC